MVVGSDGPQAAAADPWPARRDLPPAGGGNSGWVGPRLDTAFPFCVGGCLRRSSTAKDFLVTEQPLRRNPLPGVCRCR